MHGTADGAVPFALGEQLVAAARAAGDRAELIALDGVDHFAIIDPRVGPFDATRRAARRLAGLDVAR